MRKLTLPVFLMLAVVARGQSNETDREALTHIKQVLWPKAYREQNTKLLDQILADEFRVIDAEGNWSSKAEEIDYIRANRPSYESLTFAIERLDIFENGTAVVAGTGTIHAADDAGKYVLRYQSSNIFIKRGGRWQAIASHVSGIRRQPAGR